MDESTPKVLSAYDVVEKTLSDATTSHKLLTGGLKAGASQTFNLRLWLDQETPLEQGQNKTYEGKIVIIASPSDEPQLPYLNDIILSLADGADNTSTDVITVESEETTCTNTLAYDGTADNNLRYVGANPCNYVCFNNECPYEGTKYYVKDVSTGLDTNWNYFDTLESCNDYVDNRTQYECTPITMTIGGWRVVGLMNNVDDGTGKSKSRVKLIRNESLGKYSWDLSWPSTNAGSGINQWGPSINYSSGDDYSGADLMQELNGDYLNYNLSSNPMWYGYQNGYTDWNYSSGYGQNTEFDRMKALSASAQELIDDVMWYTGVYNDTSANNSVPASVAYQNERSNNPNSKNNGKYCRISHNLCNDTVTRTTSWTGKVGLINASDYGYAVGGSVRSTCLTNNLSDYDTNSCYINDWLYNRAYQWSLSPSASYGRDYDIVSVSGTGSVYSTNCSTTFMVRPSVYLLPDVKVTEGNGSATSPYKFE